MTSIRRTNFRPAPRLVSGPNKNRPKNWIFEKLEDRHLMTGDPVVDPYAGVGATEEEIAEAAASASVASLVNGVIPNDPYLGYQWHLFNTGDISLGDPLLQPLYGVAGEDANVLPAWADGYTGEGVVIAVVDSGVQLDHPDLVDNLHPFLGYNATADQDRNADPTAGATGNPFDPTDAHGTAVAGIIGATANNGIGVAGIAYNADIVPIYFLDPGNNVQSVVNTYRFGQVDDPNTPYDDVIDIYNHSWGFALEGVAFQLDPAELLELERSIENGRDGLGAIHIQSSGNGGSPVFNGQGQLAMSSYNAYLNTMYIIGVTGVDHDGREDNDDGTVTQYPVAGPNVLVAAPTGSNTLNISQNPVTYGSGIWTTDLTSDSSDPLGVFQEGYNGPEDEFGIDDDADFFEDPDYTSRFNGTSAAAPMVSGVVALMLEANPDLTYRDVQEILVRSSRQNAANESLAPGEEKAFELHYKPTWITNRNEMFRDPNSYSILNQDVIDGEADGSPIILDGPNEASTILPYLYEPIVDPYFQDGMTPNQYTNGAGYTVSQGRGFIGTSTGYAHGVVDAGLAVKLAEQWSDRNQDLEPTQAWTTFTQPPAAGVIPPAAISNQDTGFLVVPGRYGGPGNIGYYNEYAADAPFDDAPGPLYLDGDYLEIAVDGSPRSMSSVEWVEVSMTLSTGDIENLRITLVSPNGVHSELNHHFDVASDTVPNSAQYEIHDRLAGTPGLAYDPDGGTFEWTFTTNRHWGERTDSTSTIDPATGEPYPGAPTHDWYLLFENFGDNGVQVLDYEVTFNGTAIGVNTQRIQGLVGVDDNNDDIFNFERSAQFYQDHNYGTVIDPSFLPAPTEGDPEPPPPPTLNTGLASSESYLAGEMLFNRLGEVERFGDLTQESFAENVVVELYGRQVNGVEVLVDEFITGDDGNFYFDVEPPKDAGFDIDLAFDGTLTPEQEDIFRQAAARWEEVITADIPDMVVTSDEVGGTLDIALKTPTEYYVDDIVIQIGAEDIDGAGGTLGVGGPSVLRPEINLPAFGSILLDTSDTQTLEANNELFAVALHEIGHVLGAGTVWEQFGYLVDAVADADPNDPNFPPDTQYIGPQAVAEYNALLGGGSETSVPVENMAGPGSDDAHWREDVFGSELMTPFLNGDAELSRLTIAMLADMGYTVDFDQADDYSLGAPAPAAAPIGEFVSLDQEPIVAGTFVHGDPGVAQALADTDIVEYVVRVVDGEGRTAKDDPNTPDGYLAKYKSEWTITSDYFYAWDHDRIPVFAEIDPATNLPVLDPLTGAEIDGNLVTDRMVDIPGYLQQFNEFDVQAYDPESFTWVFDPRYDYDILVDDNGDPLKWFDTESITYVNGFQTLLGSSLTVQDHVRGINFLVTEGDPPAQEVVFSGQVFSDKDADGVFNGEDNGKGNVRVFVDSNLSGGYDAGEEFVFTGDGSSAALGEYSLTVPTSAIGTYQIGIELPDQFTYTLPTTGLYNAFGGPGDIFAGVDFAITPVDDGGSGGGGGTGGGGGNGGGGNGGGNGGGGTGEEPGRVEGVVYEDVNADGIRQASEVGISGVTVYIDANSNFQLDDEELDSARVTNSAGAYELSNIDPGTINVRVVAPSPFTQTSPTGNGSRTIDLGSGGSVTGLLFGLNNLADRDFGDVAGFPTLESENGAWHQIVSGVRLGARIDGELDGQPNASATGDDDNPSASVDDEDGVTPNFGGDAMISDGEEIGFTVTTAGTGYFLNAWIDFNGDGDWDDDGEHVYDDIDLNPGTWVAGVTTDTDGGVALPTITAPDVAEGVPLAARFRWGVGGLGYTGGTNVGEVEDYLFLGTTQTSTIVDGDYDGDGTVGQGDYDVWVGSYGQTGAGLPADGNGDGVVDLSDYTVWRDNLGSSAAAGATAKSGTILSQEAVAHYATLGYEVVYQTTGFGANARQIATLKPILAEELAAPVVADASPAAGSTATYVPTSPAVGRPSYGLPLTSVSVGVGSEVADAAQAARADQLDLFFADLQEEEADESLEFTSFAADEASEEDEALAIALAEGGFDSV